MKRLFVFIFVVLALSLTLNITAFAATDKGNNSFIYTDSENGVTFTVPSNWKQKEFSQDREYIDVKFVSPNVPGSIMIYGSTDMWAQIPYTEKVGHTRSDLDNSIYTKADIAELYGTTADEISMVTYNGAEYFVGTFKYSSNTSAVDVTITMTQALRIDNGWMYIFQFGGTSTDKLYSDFEKLLKSAEYPTVSNVTGIVSDTNIISSSNNSSYNYSYNDYNDDYNDDTNDFSGALVIIVLILIGVVMTTVVIFKEKNKTTANQINNSFNEVTPVVIPPIDAKNDSICKVCGQALPPDSAFCHMCGAKIEKE